MARDFKNGVSVNGTAVSLDGHTHAGGSGGVNDATYVTLSTNGTLTDERVLTAGSYVTITDGGAGSTVTVAVDATSANTVSKVVARDASGNFSAGTITASLTGTASGNVPNGRTITATAPLTIGGGASADLSADRTIAVSAASTSAAGVVQLSDSTSTTGSTKAATETAVKSAYDIGAAAVPKSTVTTQGDLIVASGNAAVTRLAAGASGAALVSGGAGTTPSYSTTINGTAIPSSSTLLTTASTTSALTSFGTSPTITTPALTLSTTTSNTEGRIAWDATNDQISVGDGAAQAVFGKLTSTTPSDLGSAAVGNATTAARANHVHGTTGLLTTTSTSSALTSFGTSPTITTPALTLSTTTDNAEGRIAWDSTNDYIKVGTSAAQATFVPASLPNIVATFSKAGTIATGTGAFRWYNDSGKTLTIGAVRASVGTAPTGASLIVDVNTSVSGAAPATIYGTQANRPTIAASAFTATGSTKSVTTIANGDYFTVDVDQVGSTVAGSDLTVLVWLSYI